MSTIKKITSNPRDAMRAHQAASTENAADRFAQAAKITQAQPTGLSPVVVPGDGVVPNASVSAVALASVPVTHFDIAACVPGAIVHVPLGLIDLNEFSPRHIYRAEDVGRIERTIADGQDDAAHGYVKGARIQLIDGGTRYRAAKATDCAFLAVKIEEAPADDLALFLRASALNDQRSQPTAMDFAISLKKLLDKGAVSTRREIVEKVAGPDGARLSESMVSMYLRIARIPEKLQREMSDSPETVTFTALYAVSEIFTEGADEETADKQLQLAEEVVDEIRRRKLSKNQITELVKSKLEGPKTRERSAAIPLAFGTSTGLIKTFAKKGQIDLSLKGLNEADLPEVRQVLVRALEDHMAKKRAGEGG